MLYYSSCRWFYFVAFKPEVDIFHTLPKVHPKYCTRHNRTTCCSCLVFYILHYIWNVAFYIAVYCILNRISMMNAVVDVKCFFIQCTS